MLKPENCPDILYDMMKDCWQRSPEQRPSFLDLCERLLPQATELFLQTAFYTSSQGAEAVSTQAALRQAQEEADLSTPLTTNGESKEQIVIFFTAGLRIRIRIGSEFNRVSGSGSGSVFSLKGWIRIRMKSMRIRNPVLQS